METGIPAYRDHARPGHSRSLFPCQLKQVDGDQENDPQIRMVYVATERIAVKLVPSLDGATLAKVVELCVPINHPRGLGKLGSFLLICLYENHSRDHHST